MIYCGVPAPYHEVLGLAQLVGDGALLAEELFFAGVVPPALIGPQQLQRGVGGFLRRVKDLRAHL